MGEYELRIVGHLDQRWADWFAPLVIRHDADGTTRLVGPVPDQAALYGLIRKAGDLGLALLSVGPLAPAARQEAVVDFAGRASPLCDHP